MCALFSSEILQAGAVRGLISGKLALRHTTQFTEKGPAEAVSQGRLLKMSAPVSDVKGILCVCVCVCSEVHARLRSDILTDQSLLFGGDWTEPIILSEKVMDLYMPVYRSSPCLKWCPTQGDFTLPDYLPCYFRKSSYLLHALDALSARE